MPDFYERRDVGNVTDFSDPSAKFEFGFEAHEQLVFNDSKKTLEVSFDGKNTHARLSKDGPTQGINWVDHVRKTVYVRNAEGAATNVFVIVIGTTR